MLTVASGARTPVPIPGVPTAAPPQLETPPSSTDGARISDVNERRRRKASPCTIHLSKRARIWTSSGGGSVPIPLPPLSPDTEFSPPSPSAETQWTHQRERACNTEPESKFAREVIVELRSLKEKVETQTELILEQERKLDLLREELGSRMNEMKEALKEVREVVPGRESRVAEKLEELIRWSTWLYRQYRPTAGGMDPRKLDTWMEARRDVDTSHREETASDIPGRAGSRLDATHTPPTEHASKVPAVLTGGGRGGGEGRRGGGGRGSGGSWLAEDTRMIRDKSIPLPALAHSVSHFDHAWSDLDSISARSLGSGVESLPASCPHTPIRPHLASPPPQFEPSESLSVPDVAPRQISENPQDDRDPRDPGPDGPDGPDSDSGSVVSASEYASARSRTSTPVEPVEPEEFMRGVSVQSDLPELKPSDGRRKARGVRWPKRGKNTRKGRMQVIDCDMCRGRVHWACASLRDNDDMTNVHWCCPDCEDFLAAEDSDGSPGRVVLAETTERCLRPDCILRGKTKKVASKRGDDDLFIIERVIGRKKVGQRVNGSRIYEYLVKWENWEMYDATWQEAKDLPNPMRWDELFVAECQRRDVDFRWRVALLPEASEWWDEDGELMRRKLDEAGVEPRTWWS